MTIWPDRTYVIVPHPDGGFTFHSGQAWQRPPSVLRGRKSHASMVHVARWLRAHSVPWRNIVWPAATERIHMSTTPKLIIKDTEHTRALGIAGMTAEIEGEVAKDTYSVIVYDMDGMPAGPYTLTSEHLEIGDKS